MDYQEDRDASGEILRIVIQRMAAQPAAFTPKNYAVWYEFITGKNTGLTEEMGALVISGTKLDNKRIDELFTRYVINGQAGAVLGEEFQQLLENLMDCTDATDTDATEYSSNLQGYGDSLKKTLQQNKVVEVVKSLVTDTEKMRKSMAGLKSELESSKQQIEKLHSELKSAKGEALIDPLTSINNRRGFEKMVGKAFAAHSTADRDMCMLMIDIDHFKQVNDTHGHLFGDKVISSVAETVKSRVRGQDTVARMGGEEFAVLLLDTYTEGARVVADNIRHGVESSKFRNVTSKGMIDGITVSVGVAAFSPNMTIEELIDQADQALYVSKRTGRNKTTIFQQEPQTPQRMCDCMAPNLLMPNLA